MNAGYDDVKDCEGKIVSHSKLLVKTSSKIVNLISGFGGGTFLTLKSTVPILVRLPSTFAYKVTIAGFDFGKSVHYWGNESIADIPGSHSWDKEKEYIEKLVKLDKVELL